MKTSSTALSALGQRIQAPPVAWLMSLQLENPKLISLATGFTDNETLPIAETRELINEVLSQTASGKRSLQYGVTQGFEDLRHLAARHVARMDAAAMSGLAPQIGVARRNVAARAHSPEHLLITNGSQQMLYLVTEALCDPGDIVIVEDPTYYVFLGIVQSHGLVPRGVRLKPGGLDLDHLDEVLEGLKKSGQIRRLKYFYTISYLQNPSGNTVNLGGKIALLERLRACEKAAGHPIYIVEDAAYRELRFAGKDVPSMRALPGGEDRVIYAATFSKPFATGVRVGYGLMPPALLEVAYRIKTNQDFGTSNLLQHLVAQAMRSGKYETHLQVTRQAYAVKAKAMTDSMREGFPAGATWSVPEGGLYVWAQLPGRQKAGLKSKFFQTALKNGVLYIPGELCYAIDEARPRPQHEMRLSFGSASEAQIRDGIRRLGRAMRK
jgi:2-aminoadipate transaminase